MSGKPQNPGFWPKSWISGYPGFWNSGYPEILDFRVLSIFGRVLPTYFEIGGPILDPFLTPFYGFSWFWRITTNGGLKFIHFWWFWPELKKGSKKGSVFGPIFGGPVFGPLFWPLFLHYLPKSSRRVVRRDSIMIRYGQKMVHFWTPKKGR